MSKIVSYMLTDFNNLNYIGITIDFDRRLKQHEKTPRFKDGIKSHKILKEYTTYEEAQKEEPLLIESYDTYNNGLNKTIDGKGNHLCAAFTTLGYKYTEEQKQNMKDNHWSRNPSTDKSWLYQKHSNETKKKISKNRSGIVGLKHCKLSLDTRILIEKIYSEDLIEFNNDFIKNHIKTSQVDKLDTLKFEDLVSKNGKPLKKIVLYKFYFSQKYNISTKAIENICLGKYIKDEKAYERS